MPDIPLATASATLPVMLWLLIGCGTYSTLPEGFADYYAGDLNDFRRGVVEVDPGVRICRGAGCADEQPRGEPIPRGLSELRAKLAIPRLSPDGESWKASFQERCEISHWDGGVAAIHVEEQQQDLVLTPGRDGTADIVLRTIRAPLPAGASSECAWQFIVHGATENEVWQGTWRVAKP